MREYELERKFLLKRLPVSIFKQDAIVVSDISQYYDKDKINRVRKQKTTSTIDPVYDYTHTKKTFIKPGMFKELENDITREEYLTYLEDYPHYIRKTRYQCIIDGYNWFIDVYRDFDLVLAEVEILTNETSLIKSKKELDELELPKVIQKELIIEVTNFKEFSNTSLV